MNEELTPELRMRQPKWTQIVFWAFMAIASLLLLFALLAPMFLGHPGKPSMLEISNAKQISLALFQFENDYGSYPDAETANEVTKAFPNHGYDLSGNSANAAFRQLIAAGIVQSEDIFYLPVDGSKKPDGDISPGHALEKGECNFAYIAVGSTSGNPSRPILMAPAIPGTTKFDPKPYNGMAIILKVDQSASAYKIVKDGHIHDSEGIDIFSPTNPIWGGKTPDIRYPE